MCDFRSHSRDARRPTRLQDRASWQLPGGMRLLIVSSYFSSSRPVRLLTYPGWRTWPGHGHEIDVIVTHPYYARWRPRRNRTVLRDELNRGLVADPLPPPSQSAAGPCTRARCLRFLGGAAATPWLDAVLRVIPVLVERSRDPTCVSRLPPGLRPPGSRPDGRDRRAERRSRW